MDPHIRQKRREARDGYIIEAQQLRNTRRWRYVLRDPASERSIAASPVLYLTSEQAVQAAIKSMEDHPDSNLSDIPTPTGRITRVDILNASRSFSKLFPQWLREHGREKLGIGHSEQNALARYFGERLGRPDVYLELERDGSTYVVVPSDDVHCLFVSASAVASVNWLLVNEIDEENPSAVDTLAFLARELDTETGDDVIGLAFNCVTQWTKYHEEMEAKV